MGQLLVKAIKYSKSNRMLYCSWVKRTVTSILLSDSGLLGLHTLFKRAVEEDPRGQGPRMPLANNQ